MGYESSFINGPISDREMANLANNATTNWYKVAEMLNAHLLELRRAIDSTTDQKISKIDELTKKISMVRYQHAEEKKQRIEASNEAFERIRRIRKLENQLREALALNESYEQFKEDPEGTILGLHNRISELEEKEQDLIALATNQETLIRELKQRLELVNENLELVNASVTLQASFVRPIRKMS